MTRRIQCSIALVATLLALGACRKARGPSRQEVTWEKALLSIAASDFDCTETQIEFKLLAKKMGQAGAQAEASGCGKKGRYVAANGFGWVLNGGVRPIAEGADTSESASPSSSPTPNPPP